MNITYLIGNGFDIALGLKTQYSDFINYYCKQDKHDYPVVVRLQQEMQSTDPECKKKWSCAEMAFAQLDWAVFSNGTKDDKVRAFRTCLKDFQDGLDIYLQRQAERVAVPRDKAGVLAERLFSKMLSLDEYLSFGHATAFRRLIDANELTLNFVVFNYTDVLERLWKACPVRPSDGCSYFGCVHGNARREVVVNRPCFVHGSFLKPPFLFGVDNSQQILDKDIREECERSGRLIKPYMDEDAALGHARLATEIVTRSDIIVTYGLSFGASDLSWWHLLHQMVFQKGRTFVCCPYYPTDIPIVNSADAHVDNILRALDNVFGALKDNRNAPMAFNRQNIRSVKVLRDMATVRDGNVVKCDYLDLTTLGDAIITPETGAS